MLLARIPAQEGQALSDIPDFWQGVLASLVAAAILGLIGFVFKISSKQVQRRNQKTREYVNQLEQKLSGKDPSERTEAAVTFIFHALKNFFIGNIFWVLPEALDAFLWGFPPVFAIKFVSLAFFFLGLTWIYRYIRAAPL